MKFFYPCSNHIEVTPRSFKGKEGWIEPSKWELTVQELARFRAE